MLDLGTLEEIKGGMAMRQHRAVSLCLQLSSASGLGLCSWKGAVIKSRAPENHSAKPTSALGPRRRVSREGRVTDSH